VVGGQWSVVSGRWSVVGGRAERISECNAERIAEHNVMRHRISPTDEAFRNEFEACTFPLDAFDHGAHVRLAYIYLAEHDVDTAHPLMRSALLNFVRHHGIDASKYHETITRAWIMAVRHFMEISPDCVSSEIFIQNNPVILDSKIMMTHYSDEVLFSDEARARFVEPDLSPIPRYAG
jgi:hypothetical protein